MSARASFQSLDEWDFLAPLNQQESTTVSRLQRRAEERPLPPHLARVHNPNSGSRPSTPNQPIYRKGSHLNLNSLLASPGHSPHRPLSAAGHRSEPRATTYASATEPLDILDPIETTQQFHDWFARVEQSMEREQEEIYRNHLAELEDHIDSCDVVLEQLDDSRGLLSEMEANYRFVEDNSRALQLACENMLDEQVSPPSRAAVASCPGPTAHFVSFPIAETPHRSH